MGMNARYGLSRAVAKQPVTVGVVLRHLGAAAGLLILWWLLLLSMMGADTHPGLDSSFPPPPMEGK
jgi:hypothetical protein